MSFNNDLPVTLFGVEKQDLVSFLWRESVQAIGSFIAIALIVFSIFGLFVAFGG